MHACVLYVPSYFCTVAMEHQRHCRMLLLDDWHTCTWPADALITSFHDVEGYISTTSKDNLLSRSQEWVWVYQEAFMTMALPGR